MHTQQKYRIAKHCRTSTKSIVPYAYDNIRKTTKKATEEILQTMSGNFPKLTSDTKSLMQKAQGIPKLTNNKPGEELE